MNAVSEVRTLVNLAAGLDARPYRLPLPADLHWIETDLPGLIRWKDQVLEAEHPACRVERIPLDLADARERRALLARLTSDGSRVLVVTEGLLVYLDEETAASLAEELGKSFPMALWLLGKRDARRSRDDEAELGQDPATRQRRDEICTRRWAPLLSNAWLDAVRKKIAPRRSGALGPGNAPGVSDSARVAVHSTAPARVCPPPREFRDAVVYALMEHAGSGDAG